MKLFITRISIYTLIILLISYSLDTLSTKGLLKTRINGFYDYTLLADGKIKDDIVVLGSSRAYTSFNPEIIDSITQLSSRVVGLDGAGCYLSRAMWKPFLENMDQKPKVLVQTIGSLEIFGRLDGINNKYIFMPFLEDPNVYASLQKLEPKLWKDRYIPLSKYRGYSKYFVLGILANLGFEFDYYTRFKGYMPLHGDWNPGLGWYKGLNPGEYSILPGLDLLNEELDLCQKKGIVFVLVYVPEHDQLSTITPFREDLISYINQMQKDNPSFLFLDYSKWEHNRDIQMFYDSWHLNAAGSKIFSIQFSKDLNSFLKKL